MFLSRQNTKADTADRHAWLWTLIVLLKLSQNCHFKPTDFQPMIWDRLYLRNQENRPLFTKYTKLRNISNITRFVLHKTAIMDKVQITKKLLNLVSST